MKKYLNVAVVTSELPSEHSYYFIAKMGNELKVFNNFGKNLKDHSQVFTVVLTDPILKAGIESGQLYHNGVSILKCDGVFKSDEGFMVRSTEGSLNKLEECNVVVASSTKFSGFTEIPQLPKITLKQLLTWSSREVGTPKMVSVACDINKVLTVNSEGLINIYGYYF